MKRLSLLLIALILIGCTSSRQFIMPEYKKVETQSFTIGETVQKTVG